MSGAARRGVTLVELMVAMAIAGIVATIAGGWIVHSARLSGSSQERDDREQRLSLLRSASFQDGTRGHVVAVTHDGWSTSFARPGTEEEDTVEWDVSEGMIRRNGHLQLPSDSVVESRLVPHRVGEDPAVDPWTFLDRDLDGAVDPEWVARLGWLDWSLVVRHKAFLGRFSELDTIRVTIPLLGPG